MANARTMQESSNRLLERQASNSLASGHSSLSSNGNANGSGSAHEDSRHLSSSADYDHIRNSTLMFFLDRLYLASKEGQEPRTLHDLSCLFGTRDFTREMRQIVGASRNGLKKFLQSYPSLFTIDGDKVYLSQLSTEAGRGSQRDYNKEAVDYFTQKLLQFGSSLVPIRNLFGYRSQASQEVRHVSGKNTKEFKEFLGENEDVFRILAEEQVVLVSALKELEESGKLDELKPTELADGDQANSAHHQEEASKLAEQQLHSLPAERANNNNNNDITLRDPYLSKQFAHTIEECMRRMELGAEGRPERISVEALHAKILDECQNELFLKMVRTINDLKLFLRMHPKIFKRLREEEEEGGREFVRLLSEEERRELEVQAYPGANAAANQQVRRANSSLRRCDISESNPSDQNSSRRAPEQQALERLETASLASSTSSSMNNSSLTAGSSLRASAPPFVPRSRTAAGSAARQPAKARQEPPGKPHRQAVERSHSSGQPAAQFRRDGVCPARRPFEPTGEPNGRAPLQRSCSALKAADAGGGLQQRPGAQSARAGQQQQPLVARQTSGLAGEDLRARTVNIVREASNIISRIMASAEAVAFDCKGYNLGFNGQITLIQFGWLPGAAPEKPAHLRRLLAAGERADKEEQKPEVCIFDLITNPELAYCLKPLLESDKIVKIVHDVRNKSNALHVQFDIMLNNVFDTQVANLVIQQQETGKPAYKSRYISMGRLCEVYGNDSLNKYRSLIQGKTRHFGHSANNRNKDVNYWLARPLSDAMVYEATMDVYSLVSGVYQNLKDKLRPEYEPLFEQLNLEGVLARIKPEEIRSVKKERKIDLEVIDLKRKLYSDTKSSIVLSNREIRLLRHIELTPEVRQKIQQCKKVTKKLERLDMKSAQLEAMLNNAGAGEQEATAEGSLPRSIPDSSSTGSSLNLSGSSLAQHEAGEEETREEFGNLMSSAIFDELKDKMIDSSSSLLESIKDDDDQDQDPNQQAVLLGNQSKRGQLEHSASQCSSCGCNCQKDNSLDVPKTVETPTPEEPPPATPEITKHKPPNDTLESQSKTEDTHSLEGKLETRESLEPKPEEVRNEEQTSLRNDSKAVDMAIQCDLLG